MSEKRGLYWKRGFTECFSNWETVWATLICIPCSFGKLASLSGFGRGVLWTILIAILYIIVQSCGFFVFQVSISKYGLVTGLLNLIPFYDLFTDDKTDYDGDIMILELGEFIFWTLFLTFVFCLRKRIRSQRNIPGSGWRDCCCSFWCFECSMCQMLNEYEGEVDMKLWDPCYYPEIKNADIQHV